MNITFIPVESSNIKAIGYDAGTEALYIAFLNNTTYRYDGVQSTLYAAFLAAESHGRFFHSNIKPSYQATKIDLNSLLPRIFIIVDAGVVEVVGATINCVVSVFDKDVQSLGEYPLKAVTDAELDRLIRLEESNFPSEEE